MWPNGVFIPRRGLSGAMASVSEPAVSGREVWGDRAVWAPRQGRMPQEEKSTDVRPACGDLGLLRGEQRGGSSDGEA